MWDGIVSLSECGMVIILSSPSDNIPALCCAPSQPVAECLDCILQAMLDQKGVPL